MIAASNRFTISFGSSSTLVSIRTLYVMNSQYDMRQIDMAHLPAVTKQVVYDSVRVSLKWMGLRMPGMLENDRVKGFDKLSPPILHIQAGRKKPIIIAIT